MDNNLFLSRIAEIEISYSTKISPSDRLKITCSRDAADIFMQVVPGMEHREYFYAMFLNRSNQVLGYYEVSKGGISGTMVDVRLILQAAIKSNSSAVILCHNHPSGTMQPSDADVKITGKIKAACSQLDINVLDHIIVSTHSYYSFADEGML
jgi:DNA repair protein RadC